MLWLDFETRSHCDLGRFGLLHYAQHPSTEVICMSYAFDDGDVQTWFAEDAPFPDDVRRYITQTDCPLIAHNASFERHIFDFVVSNDHDLQPPKLHRWRCSSARAMAHGLPGKLGEVCKALGIPLQKQTEGTRLIRDYCAPHFKTDWGGDDKQLMQNYCEMDVLAMRQFCSVLRELSDDEWHEYHVTEKMNDRGVPIDVPFVTAALEYADEFRSDVSRQIAELTGGAVEKATERKSRDQWLADNLSPELLEVITVTKNDVEKIKFDQESRHLLLAQKDVPEHVVKFVHLVEDAGGATISKYKAMANQHVDGRVHNAMVWSGAGATGRWTSRGLQLQNFRRDAYKEPEPYIDAVITGAGLDTPAETLGRLIRSAITSPDGLTFSDYSQIEARVLPWLSADPLAEKTLDVFRADRDIYTENAVGMFRLRSADDVTPDLRQSAKQGVLACGFGGGARAVQAMARNYGLNFDHEQADDIKKAWRAANPWATPFWYGLKDASRAAYQQPGTVHHCGRLSFMYDGGDWLWMRLPSGRCLAYCKPAFELVEYPWMDGDKPAEGWELTCLWGSARPKFGRKWPRRTLSHLILAENATQAAAADIMRETVVRADDAGLPILFSVHDELVTEGNHVDTLTELMETPPAWADGLPIAAETQYAPRYGK